MEMQAFGTGQASASAMKDRSYWKKHYVMQSDSEKIERAMKIARFASAGRDFELIYFEKGKGAPNILVSQGSGGHAYIFAELAYLMHLRGYNVFVMPKHGGYTVSELVQRHKDAVGHISKSYGSNTGVFAEGLGCYAVFYLALAGEKMKSMVLLNGPAIMTEEKFHKAILGGKDATSARRKRLLPFVRLLARIFPCIKIPIYSYLDFRELVDTKEENAKIERPMVDSFSDDPDFDMRYPLSAVMSLLSTPPPQGELSNLKTPTMFVVPLRGFFPSYFRDLYARLPAICKRLVEVDGSVFWMLSHPQDAAKMICEWFDETLDSR